MSATEAGTTLLDGAALPTNGQLRAGDQTSIARTRPASRSRQRGSPAPYHEALPQFELRHDRGRAPHVPGRGQHERQRAEHAACTDPAQRQGRRVGESQCRSLSRTGFPLPIRVKWRRDHLGVGHHLMDPVRSKYHCPDPTDCIFEPFDRPRRLIVGKHPPAIEPERGVVEAGVSERNRGVTRSARAG